MSRGRAIINIAKALKPYADNTQILHHLSATRTAGRAGLFASSIRGHSTKALAIGLSQRQALLAESGIDSTTFKFVVRPWLERNALAYFDSDPDGQEALVSNILTYDAMLLAVAELHQTLDTKDCVGQACQLLIHLASEIPISESSALQQIAQECDDRSAQLAVDLSRGFKLVSFNQPPGAGEAIIFSERVWKTAGQKAAKAIAKLPAEDRAVLQLLVGQVKGYQGYPEPLLRKQAKENNAERILDLAIGVELLTKTGVRVGNTIKYFLMTPHFYVDVEEQFGEDVCDRVKIFLDSIRNGQHFSQYWRGRVLDPSELLGALLNRGSIGPCTAIGEDYTMAESAGIIKVERSAYRPGQYHMVLAQADVVKKALEIIDRKAMSPSAQILTPEGFADKGIFMSQPEARAKLGELPGEMQDVEQDFLNALREN